MSNRVRKKNVPAKPTLWQQSLRQNCKSRQSRARHLASRITDHKITLIFFSFTSPYHCLGWVSWDDLPWGCAVPSCKAHLVDVETPRMCPQLCCESATKKFDSLLFKGMTSPETHSIIRITTSVSVTKCPLILLVHFTRHPVISFHVINRLVLLSN